MVSTDPALAAHALLLRCCQLMGSERKANGQASAVDMLHAAIRQAAVCEPSLLLLDDLDLLLPAAGVRALIALRMSFQRAQLK